MPVEILPFAATPVLPSSRALGCKPVIRGGIKKRRVITDNGNFIADCSFYSIESPALLEAEIGKSPVWSSGLFTGFADKTTLIIGNKKECKIVSSADIVP